MKDNSERMWKLCLAPLQVKEAEKAAMDTQEWLPLTSLVEGVESGSKRWMAEAL